MTSTLTLAPVTTGAIPAIIEMMQAQARRLQGLDPRLSAPLSDAQYAHLLDGQGQSSPQPLLLIDEDERVRGYAQPALWELSETSTLHAFLTARNGIASALTLPGPDEEDAVESASALLAALSDFWQREGTTGDLVRWPSADRWIERALDEHGFQLDSVCALHPPGMPHVARRVASSSLVIRRARPEDEDVLVALFAEEMRVHEACIPFARLSLSALQGFRQKLTRVWSETPLESGVALVLAAEQHGQVVAMAENILLSVAGENEPGFTLAGRYGCIDNVCVAEGARGQGIGYALVQAAFAALVSLSPDGYLLWYNPGNPLAEQFWPHLGFAPLWTTYQRLHQE